MKFFLTVHLHILKIKLQAAECVQSVLKVEQMVTTSTSHLLITVTTTNFWGITGCQTLLV